MIIGTQILIARILLGLTQRELVKLSDVPLSTLARTEGRRTVSYGKAETMKTIQTALEKQGVKFVNSNSEVGVILEMKIQLGIYQTLFGQCYIR